MLTNLPEIIQLSSLAISNWWCLSEEKKEKKKKGGKGTTEESTTAPRLFTVEHTQEQIRKWNSVSYYSLIEIAPKNTQMKEEDQVQDQDPISFCSKAEVHQCGEGGPEVKTIFIIILRSYLPFLLFFHVPTVEFSRDYTAQNITIDWNEKVDLRIQLSFN